MSDKEEVLSHFTTLETLFHMFEWGGIPLYDASRWDDLVDRAMVELGCKELGAVRYGVMCFMNSDFVVKDGDKTKSVDQCETYAHWKVYSKPLNVDVPSEALKMGIRIDFRRDVLMNQVGESNVNAVAGNIEYVDFRKYSKVAKTMPKDKCAFFIKRAAYSWENEARLIVLDQRLDDISEDARKSGATAFVPIADWHDLIRNIVYSPLCKIETYPGVPQAEQIQYYAKESLHRRCLSVKCWESEAKDRCVELLNSGYRSGVLDNETALSSADEAKRKIKKSECVAMNSPSVLKNKHVVHLQLHSQSERPKVLKSVVLKGKGQ